MNYLMVASNLTFLPTPIDFPPDNIESLYDELEDPADAARILANLSPREAGWLARHISGCIEKERANNGDEIECRLMVSSSFF